MTGEMKPICVRGGEVITAESRTRADVYCEGGVIKAVGPDLDCPADTQEIDASGAYVLPGAVDAHVHMELAFMGTVSSDDFETGTAAGVAGGTTTIIDFVIPPHGQPLLDGLAEWHEKAEKAVADYAFHMAVTWWGDDTAAEMAACVRDHGIPSFKTFMAYKGAIGIEDDELLRVMQTAQGLGALVTAHCEDGDAVVSMQEKLLAEGKTAPKYHALSRPAPVEGRATERAAQLAREAGCPLYIVHMTCQESIDAVSAAQDRGQPVLGETCVQYLLLDDSVYDTEDFEGAAYVMSPPIRPAGHQDALWDALSTGTIHTVATDHCPFNLDGQKDMGLEDFTKVPNGAAGIEHRLSLMHTHGVMTGRLSLEQWVDACCTQPARLFGLAPRKGTIAPGADADIVLFDPAATATISAATHHHKVDRSIYEGFPLTGTVRQTLVGGRVQWNDGDLQVERGAGRYLPRTLS